MEFSGGAFPDTEEIMTSVRLVKVRLRVQNTGTQLNFCLSEADLVVEETLRGEHSIVCVELNAAGTLDERGFFLTKESNCVTMVS